MTTEVVHVPDRHRYELRHDATLLGYAAYQIRAYQKADELIVPLTPRSTPR
jgi:hypothetical protein